MPHAKRMLTSILVLSKTSFLIDAGFDVMDRLGDYDLNFILLTHWHMDHIAGLFRLRWSASPVTIYAPEGGLNSEIKREPRNLRVKLVKPYESFEIEGVKISTIPLIHSIECLGYLIDDGDSRVVTMFDCKGIAERDINTLRSFKANLALIDATEPPGFQGSNHNNVDEAVNIGYKIEAEHIILTHIAHHNMSLTKLTSYVRRFKGVTVAHDNMVLTA